MSVGELLDGASAPLAEETVCDLHVESLQRESKVVTTGKERFIRESVLEADEDLHRVILVNLHVEPNETY